MFFDFDEGERVTMTYTVEATTGFGPLLTPRYDLGDNDYMSTRTRPVTVERVDLYSLPSIQRIEVTSRSNDYAVTPIEARDQAQIETYGPRVGSTITAHEICDEFTVAPVVAQLILAARALCPGQIHLQAWVAVLSARTDGHGDDHRPGLGPSTLPASASSRSRRTTTAS